MGRHRGSCGDGQPESSPKGPAAPGANAWGQRSESIKGKEKKERGQRGTCAPWCFMCSECWGRITSLPVFAPQWLGAFSPPYRLCMRMSGCWRPRDAGDMGLLGDMRLLGLACTLQLFPTLQHLHAGSQRWNIPSSPRVGSALPK